MEDFRVIIAGGRDFDNYELLKAKCDSILSSKAATHKIIVVSGAAKGADKLGEQYAREKGYAIDSRPADWNTHGKSAGFIRNAQMANSADALIAFWDGQSHGTKHMIDTALRNGLAVRTVLYHNNRMNSMNIKESDQRNLSEIDYLIDEDNNEVIIETDEINTDELCRMGKAMGGKVSTTDDYRTVFTFDTAQEGHNFGSTMVELAKARALGNHAAADSIIKNVLTATSSTMNQNTSAKMNEVSQYAIEYITGKGMHSGVAWLRDSFNELCEETESNEYRPEDIDFDLDDLNDNLKKAPWVVEIASKSADNRTSEDITRVVENFICEYWLKRPEEVTSKDVADVLKVADPYSFRQLLAQKVAINCIHALDHEQLQQLDAVLSDIARNPSESRVIRR